MSVAARATRAPYDKASAVTLHDTNTIDPTLGVYVGGAGNLKVRMAKGGNDVTFNGVAAGTILPIEVDRCYSTGSTATNVVALYAVV